MNFRGWDSGSKWRANRDIGNATGFQRGFPFRSGKDRAAEMAVWHAHADKTGENLL